MFNLPSVGLSVPKTYTEPKPKFGEFVDVRVRFYNEKKQSLDAASVRATMGVDTLETAIDEAAQKADFRKTLHSQTDFYGSPKQPVRVVALRNIIDPAQFDFRALGSGWTRLIGVIGQRDVDAIEPYLELLSDLRRGAATNDPEILTAVNELLWSRVAIQRNRFHTPIIEAIRDWLPEPGKGMKQKETEDNQVRQLVDLMLDPANLRMATSKEWQALSDKRARLPMQEIPYSYLITGVTYALNSRLTRDVEPGIHIDASMRTTGERSYSEPQPLILGPYLEKIREASRRVSLSESKLKPLLDENSVHLDGRGVDERSSLGQPTQPWYDKLGSVPLSQPTGGNRLTDDFYRSWGIFHDVHKDGLAGQTGRNTLQNPFTVDLHQAIRKSFDIFKVTPEEADAIASAAAKDESPVTLSVVKNYGGTRPDRTLASGGRNRDPRTTGTPQWSRNSPNSSSPQPPASQRGRVRAWFLDRLKRGLPIPGLEDIQGK